MTDPGDDNDLSYADALEELDDILDQLESSTVDVDVLADRVARGAVLVRFCRQRLGVVKTDVEAVVEDLLDESVTGSPESQSAANGAD